MKDLVKKKLLNHKLCTGGSTKFTFGGYKQKTFVNSLYISLSSDLFVALSPSVRRLRERGWKQKIRNLSIREKMTTQYSDKYCPESKKQGC